MVEACKLGGALEEGRGCLVGSSPPEEAPQPGHLAHGEVKAAGHKEVSHCQQALGGVQVGDGPIHSSVEGWDHCSAKDRVSRAWILHHVLDAVSYNRWYK